MHNSIVEGVYLCVWKLLNHTQVVLQIIQLENAYNNVQVILITILIILLGDVFYTALKIL